MPKMSHPIIRLPGLSQNATDVRFIEGRGLPRSRSVSEDGVVEPFENRADGVFCNVLVWAIIPIPYLVGHTL